MTDACKICETEAIELDEWFLRINIQKDGKIAIVECICPWCVKEMMNKK